MLELRNLLRQVRKNESAQSERTKVHGGVISIKEVIRMKLKEHPPESGVDETWLRLQLQSILDGKDSLLGPYDGVDGAWKDEPCFLVAGSKGLKNAIADGFRFPMLKGFHTIGVNHVIEDYHDFEWLFFLDKRLIDISPYDIMGKYKGRMFAHLKTKLTPDHRTTIIYTQRDGPSEHIIQGLFSFVVSGLTALNLALISGANPIYLLGIDNGGRARKTVWSITRRGTQGRRRTRRRKHTGGSTRWGSLSSVCGTLHGRTGSSTWTLSGTSPLSGRWASGRSQS